MMWILHSGLFSFAAAIFIAVVGSATWQIGRSVPVAIMNGSFVLLNMAMGIMQVASHPEIWQ